MDVHSNYCLWSLCGLSGLLQAQLLLTQKSLASAAWLLLRCSPCHRSSHRTPPRNTESNRPFSLLLVPTTGARTKYRSVACAPMVGFVSTAQLFHARRIHALASTVDPRVTDTPVRKEIGEDGSELALCLFSIGPKCRRNITNLDIGNLSHISDDGIH